ncbi:hypothetical protein CEP54_015068 [Fusarium duplospermum]|uniref:Protein kinase domain-containing protein n=1 Tax=Fusarium duplospermum TaxID=1325734 RepID=A0A428NRV5_9HYPO|nr:hypothetical protein CEP54_015068 [Fusarium duplospermum]
MLIRAFLSGTSTLSIVVYTHISPAVLALGYDAMMCWKFLDDETRKGLPEKVVMKKEAEDLFNNEYMVYQHLQELQGKYIPNCYGVTYVDGSRSLILSDVGGITMMDDRMPLMEDDELISKLTCPLESGILLEDVSPTNMLYCDDRFVAIDFQYARVEKNLQAAAEDVDEQVEALIERADQTTALSSIPSQSEKKLECRSMAMHGLCLQVTNEETTS